MSGFARGKLILAGEHAVVYGHPAIAMGVDRGTRVSLSHCEGPTHLPGGADPRLAAALRLALPPHGVRVDVHSDLPVGRGMGSSAALAVALLRARDGDVPPDALFDAALALETVFHGNASGLDVHIAIHGGAVRYRRGPPREAVALPAPGWSVVVIDTGDAGDTRRMVRDVAARRPSVDGLLADIGALALAVEDALHSPAQLGPLWTRHHALLRRLGVSTPRLDAATDAAHHAGALGAKLSGAGGGGVVIAVPEGPPDALVERLRAVGHDAFVARAAT